MINALVKDNRLYLTDSGLETMLVFHEGWELPEFAACELLKSEKGRKRLEDYFKQHAAIAAAGEFGFVMEAPTWRSNPDWGRKLGYDEAGLDALNRQAIGLMQDWRNQIRAAANMPVVISGCVGPRGDGYVAGEAMTPEEAQDYHQAQVNSFAAAGADVVSAITMTNVNEAVGVALAAKKAGVPCVISFTVETDGRLPSGTVLKDAIADVDAATGAAPAYYMINCAHPDHFLDTLEEGAGWMTRIRGLRANASRCSHAELDEAEELDDGNPQELGEQYHALLAQFPHLRVLGGCCGTDFRHIEQIARACAA